MPVSFSRIFGDSRNSSTIYTALAIGVIGGVLLPELSDLFSWIRLHLVFRSKLSRYHHFSSLPKETPELEDSRKDHPWAFITGASDGIGYGFVQELAANNFNVILHGRNPAKLEKLIHDLKTQYPHLSFESFTCNATDRSSWASWLPSMVKRLTELKINLTILINNVGGNPRPLGTFMPLADYTQDELCGLIDINAAFPASITSALLPILIMNKPSLIMNVSSASSTENITIPYLTAYSGAKAFNSQFSKTLRLEMTAVGHREVEVISVVAARVQSAGMKTATGISTPSSRAFARSALQKVGCGRPEVTAWWSHSVQIWGMSIIPDWMREMILVKVGRDEKQAFEENNPQNQEQTSTA